MRHRALARSILAAAFVVLAGSGCDQLLSALQEAEQRMAAPPWGPAARPA